MSYSFRDADSVLGPNATVEIPQGAAAPTQVKLQLLEVVSFNAVAAPAAGSISLFVAPSAALYGSYSLVGVSATFSTASTSGTLDVKKDLNVTQAPGAGTSLLTGTMSLSGTANTTVNGTLITNPATLQLAAGDRLSVTFGGTLTNLANLCINLYVVRTA